MTLYSELELDNFSELSFTYIPYIASCLMLSSTVLQFTFCSLINMSKRILCAISYCLFNIGPIFPVSYIYNFS